MQPDDMTQISFPAMPAAGPFCLNDETAYHRWREKKLSGYPQRASELRVTIADPFQLSSTEQDALQRRIEKTNFVIYQLANPGADDKGAVKALGKQFGLRDTDSNLCADEDSITSLKVIPGGRQQHYIPYSNLRLSWHTDGYYNALDRQIRAMVLHCVQDAAEGGENLLLDHEICYIHLRDTNPAYILALMQPDAMVIPPNVENGVEIRGALSGPVFTVDPDTGSLHMRYTARTRSIEWHADPTTLAAKDCIQDFLGSDSPYIFRHRLAPGQGVLTNNVLHARTAFENEEGGKQRLLYRARYYNRIAHT
ncbi:MAG: TauD/TfdA family dioxygenase [Proteobacteria bacterium]|jgi:alpha-ketoglutarate-dependent taurine dioxygenase|nr:TauD/TfdA family dioxygenase [Pseudomonadota bacterium]